MGCAWVGGVWVVAWLVTEMSNKYIVPLNKFAQSVKKVLCFHVSAKPYFAYGK